ncbi:hypothetical protein XENOCAPTIV_013317 [Xenoophorus captivus]|uniref:Uncharacterized protein n=1 Tax=Xenoophorus captivus TaxID=1517983 RepID=A0ABV0QAH3_9TELE
MCPRVVCLKRIVQFSLEDACVFYLCGDGSSLCGCFQDRRSLLHRGLKPTPGAFFTFMFTVAMVAYTATSMAMAISADQTVVAIANIYMTITCVFMMVTYQHSPMVTNAPVLLSADLCRSARESSLHRQLARLVEVLKYTQIWIKRMYTNHFPN